MKKLNALLASFAVLASLHASAEVPANNDCSGYSCRHILLVDDDMTAVFGEHDLLVVNAASQDDVEITLPLCWNGHTGKTFSLIKSGLGTVTIQPDGQDIDGLSSLVLDASFNRIAQTMMCIHTGEDDQSGIGYWVTYDGDGAGW